MADNKKTEKKAFDKNDARHILLFAIGVSLICSILVSASAVVLAERQKANVLLDQRRNILIAAGILQEGESQNEAGQGVHEIFESEFERQVVDLSTGQFVADVEDSYDQLRASRQSDMSMALPADKDIAVLVRRENLSNIYLKKNQQGQIDTIVLPVRGYGLWGTLYGYLALRGDYRTVAGLGFYTHKETPGLGGEVDNPRWKAQWLDKVIYDSSGQPAIRLLKTGGKDEHSVDALAGATLTSRGVENLVNFWTGDLGFGPFLRRMESTRSNL